MREREKAENVPIGIGATTFAIMLNGSLNIFDPDIIVDKK